MEEKRTVLSQEVVPGDDGLERTNNYHAVDTEDLSVEVDTNNGEILQTVPPETINEKDLNKGEEQDR